MKKPNLQCGHLQSKQFCVRVNFLSDNNNIGKQHGDKKAAWSKIGIV